MKRKLIACILSISLCTSFSYSLDVKASSSTYSEIETEDVISLADATTLIDLNNLENINYPNVKIENNIITITAGGNYAISGDLADGQIIVDSEDDEYVRILLNGVNISSSSSSAIYIKNAKKTILTLAENSKNNLSDGSTYIYNDPEADEPDATIFSKDDLIINGTGSLIINGNYKNCIRSKDDLTIENGDGLKATNSSKATKGYVRIDGGNINITSGEDGIQAESYLLINNGNINILSGNGSEYGEDHTDNDFPGGNRPSKNDFNLPYNETNDTTDSSTTEEESTSKKGIKAETNIEINGGTININSADDSIHSINDITINNGLLNLESGDDGINATTCTSEDTIDEIPTNPNYIENSTAKLTINGGTVVVNADGDGLDANGSIYINGGTTIINGPEDNNNGAIDYDNECIITGGTFIASGSLGMAQIPSKTSAQPIINLSISNQDANSIINVSDENGNSLITFAPTKKYQSVIISSPNIESNKTYFAYTGGTSTDINIVEFTQMEPTQMVKK